MRDGLLRRALFGNAVFSLASGGALAALAQETARLWAPGVPALVVRVIGAGVALFGLDVLYQATRPRLSSLRAELTSFADLAWVLGSIALLSFRRDLLSAQGVQVVSGVALVVALLAGLQLRGIVRLFAHPDPAGSFAARHTFTREVPAAPAALWPVVGDLGNIHKYVPSLASSRLLGGEAGVGAQRECRDVRGRRWRELCTAYEPGRAFSLRFQVDEPDFPFPVVRMDGGWELKPTAAAGTCVRVYWDVTPRGGPFGLLMLPVMAAQIDREMSMVVERMAAAAQTEVEAAPFKAAGA